MFREPYFRLRLFLWRHYKAAKLRFGKYVDPLTLGLARRRRRRLKQTVFIGVTGSSGKTTTKDLAASVLSSRYRGTWNRGTSNRELSLMTTLLRTRVSDRFLIQELGASGPKSLIPLIEVLRPDIGVITVVGEEHSSAFRSLDAVAREKARLIRGLSQKGIAILNADDPLVREMAAHHEGRTILYGARQDAEVRAVDISSSWPETLRFTLQFRGETVPVRTQLLGRHWASSVLAAIACGIALEVPLEEAVAAVGAVKPHPGRMSPTRLPGGIDMISDDWKAPSWSLPQVLEFVGEARAKRKILVLGHISDERTKPRKYYPRLAREALSVADLVLFVGRWAHHAQKGLAPERRGHLLAFTGLDELTTYLSTRLRSGDLLTVKGSGTSGRISEHLALKFGQH